ncbi:MAG: exosortase T [Pseudomonadota bacterium]
MLGNRDIALQIGLLAASALLALAPVQWLIQSWSDPSYQSDGLFYFTVLMGVMLWSWNSGNPGQKRPLEAVLPFFLLAACVRLAGQLVAINILAAFALAIDVYVIALWLGLDQRRRALSPFWLAVFFLFAMPLGPVLERALGFPLQMVSAELACGMLSPFFRDLVCEGVRLRIGDLDVLVDLPCSGATALLLLLGLWALLNAVYRPSPISALGGGVLILFVALLGNALRISLLAAGLVHEIDTMAPLPHLAVGLFTLVASVLPVLIFYRPRAVAAPRGESRPPRLPRAMHVPAAILIVLASIAIVQAPKTPIDRSQPVIDAPLPGQLLGFQAVHIPLTEIEAAYFSSFGGTATKAQYGPLGLNVVRTGSPLRHLHSPATCLLGLGFKVRFLGTRFDPVPSSVYEATAPDGQVWHVAVSFISANGYQTASVGEAVWSWLSGTSRRWKSVQRITPASLPPRDRAAFEQAALSALDL